MNEICLATSGQFSQVPTQFQFILQFVFLIRLIYSSHILKKITSLVVFQMGVEKRVKREDEEKQGKGEKKRRNE